MLRLHMLFLLLGLATPALALDASQVAIIYNDSFAGSKEVALAYAQARNIPTERHLALMTSVEEVVDRATYDDEIKAKITAFMDKQADVIALVLCRGMPLKIKESDTSNDSGQFDGRDFASVDSELMTLRLPEQPLTKAFENPFINKEAALTKEDKLLIVHRLDGPTQEIALGLIEKAILAESFGTYGTSFLDTGPTNPGYKTRDDDMAKIATTWTSAKIPFTHDSTPAVYDLSQLSESPLHYNGWYVGSPGKWKGDFRFRTGSVAVHLHSFSASTLRDAKKNWCAPLLAWGATATLGTVYEPYTVGFPYEMIYWDRLCKGFTFGDAGAMSNHLISWQSVFIGDPLYTPYAKGREAEFGKRRKALAAMLEVKADKAEALAGSDLLLVAAERYLRVRLEGIVENLKKKPDLAMNSFADLSFLTRDMGLEEAIGPSLGDLNKGLESRFKDIKAALKKRINDTVEYEVIRQTWRGLEIYAEVEKFHESLVKDQIKEAEAWLKQAKAHEKSNAFDAWFDANQASLCQYAPEQAAEAKTLADKIDDENRKEKKYMRTPNSKTKAILSKAEGLEKRKPEEAIELLRLAILDYPKCDGRNDCEKALERIRARLAEEKGK